MEERDVVIIGGGPAGLAAAVYCRRAGLKTVVLERGNWGGAINRTEEIENYPAIKHTSGPEIGKMFVEHAKAFSTEMVDCTVEGIKLDGKYKIVSTSNGDYKAKVVIVATGAEFRKLGCPGEAEYTGKGVSYCATCDAAFTEGEEVAVVGGGNTAVEEGCYLTQFASKVYIIHRRDQFRADEMAVERMLKNPKVQPVYSTVVERIEGDGDMVTKAVLKNVKTGEISELPVAFVFMFVGTQPNNELVKDLVKCSEKGGWVETDDSLMTSVPGIFAAGDVRQTPLRQVITAASDGAVAGMSAYKYIAANF
jgi:thioredoxin reductase (NADPH)